MRVLLWPTDVFGTSLSVCAAHQEWLWQADNRALLGGWCCVEPLCTLGVPGSLWGSGQREKESEKKNYSQLKLAPLSLWQPPFTGERSASQIIYRNRLILPNVSFSLSLSLSLSLLHTHYRGLPVTGRTFPLFFLFFLTLGYLTLAFVHCSVCVL